MGQHTDVRHSNGINVLVRALTNFDITYSDSRDVNHSRQQKIIPPETSVKISRCTPTDKSEMFVLLSS